jgi:farnesyl-diphosphate farnesyltransferase
VAHPSITAELTPAPAAESSRERYRRAERFGSEILPRVSRTFALSIRVLPGELGRAVLSAYLVCRVADTIEDDPALPAREKAALLEALLEALDDAAAADRLPARLAVLGGESAHVALCRNADLVLVLHRALGEPSRGHVRHWVREMVTGMREFVLRYPHGIRIETLEEYREYCYYVAGTVGYMLTDLWRAHSPSIGNERYRALRERCRAFAEALQTVNILKDVAADAETENSIYVPARALAAQGSSHAMLLAPSHRARNLAAMEGLVQLARHDCDLALEYLTLLPRRAIAIRLFCLLPLVFCFATLRELVRPDAMLRPEKPVKIRRGEVRALLAAAPFVVASNALVRGLMRRVRRRAFAPWTARA